MTQHFLSFTQFAQHVNLSTGALGTYNRKGQLPEPDAMIGDTRGWLESTVNSWIASRPGRGVGGGRPKKNT